MNDTQPPATRPTTTPRSLTAPAAWEDATVQAERVSALMAEHAPQGPTETHLVEQLAHLMLRRQRLVQAEQGLLAAGLLNTIEHSWGRRALIERVKLIPGGDAAEESDIKEALTSDDAADRELIADAQACLDSLHAALAQLQRGDLNTYEAALARLHADMRHAWEDVLSQANDGEDEPEWRPSASDLGRYIETELKPWMTKYVENCRAYPLIRTQARAQAYEPEKMATLYDLDARLTRQFEKTLAMLIRLQDMRRGGAEGSP